jgi:hypothetical protein
MTTTTGRTRGADAAPVAAIRMWSPWRERLVTGGVMLLGVAVFMFGGLWDIQWHRNVGRDQTFTPPHDMILGGITLCGIAALAAILSETYRARTAVIVAPTVTFIGMLRGSLGAYLAGFAALAAAVAFPLDNYWHSLNGIDVTLWAPFHVMFIGGMALAGLGVATHCAEIAEARLPPTVAQPTLMGRLAQAGVFAGFGTGMATLLVLLGPALNPRQGVHLGPHTIISLYPLYLGLMGLVVLFVATTRLRWTGLATGIVLVVMVVRLLATLFVPPAMRLLVQMQHQTYLPNATQSVVGVVAMSPILLIVALGIDGALWFAQRRRWSPLGANWFAVGAATVITFCIALVTVALTQRALVRGSAGTLRLALAPSLLLGVAGAIAGGWLGIAIARALVAVPAPAASSPSAARPWRPWWQTALASVAALALVATLVTLGQIVFAADIHSETPAQVFPVTAGAYRLDLTLYTYPATAGYAQPFTITPQAGSAVPQSYSLIARPDPSVIATPITASLGSPDAAGRISGSVYITVRGLWTLDLTITGAQGTASAAIPISATAPPALSPAFAWNLGLLPLYGLLLFTGIALWRNRQVRAMSPAGA